MNQIRILTILCAGILLWMITCTTDSDKSDLLTDALNTVDTNPQEALKLLETITPGLYEYDKDQHMLLVVLQTQARYMDYQDITGDSLILDAQRYFARTQNYEMAARAGYYAAIYWHEGEAGDKAVEYWKGAFSSSEKAGNNLFMAKSTHQVGAFYYNKEEWEDALPYCRKALALYQEEYNADHYKLDIIEMLGQIYREQQDLEQAYQYFDNGLEEAKKLNNTKYESRFLRDKGIIHWEKKEYRQAKQYFDLAFSKQLEIEEAMRIYLSYAKLYRAMNLPDSTRYYLNTIEDQMQKITYPITRRDIYAELVAYYKSQGDGDKIARYSKLAHTEDLQIKKSLSEKKIEAINQQLEQIKQKKQTEWRTYRRIFDYGLIALCILVSLLAIIWFNKHGLKKQFIQITEKYKNIRYLQFSQTVDLQHFLLAGLRIIAKGTDYLYQKEPAYAGSPIWQQQLMLREEFSIQLAGYLKTNLEKMHNGKSALQQLTPEDLSIIHLSRLRYPDEEIGWLLGHKDNTKESIKLRKEQILRILTEAGMKEKDIKTFFIIESH